MTTQIPWVYGNGSKTNGFNGFLPPYFRNELLIGKMQLQGLETQDGWSLMDTGSRPQSRARSTGIKAARGRR